MKRLLALLLAAVMLCTLVPFAAFAAETSGKLVVMTEKGTKEVSMTASDSGAGWTWNAKSSWTDESGGSHVGVLTLSSFSGQSIFADGDLKIVLKGKNTLKLPPKGEYGIKVSGKLLIDKSSSSGSDTLTVIQENTASSSNLILTGGKGDSKNCVINGGTVTLENTTGGGRGTGIYYNATVNNDASLSINVPYKGVASTLTANTKGKISVITRGKETSAAAVSALNARGTGAVELKATAPALAISDALSIGSSAGAVTLNGFVKVSSDPLTKFNVAVNKRIKDSDSYYQGYYTTNSSGTKGYFLTNLQGVPMSSASYVTADSQTLTVMDSPLFDIAKLTLNQKLDMQGVGIKNGTRGGAGDYRFSLKLGSTLPKGLTLNEKTGEISGTPTEVCEAGKAVIVIKDKGGASGCSQTEISINYAAVRAADAYIKVGSSADIDMTRNVVDAVNKWSYTGVSRTLTLEGYDGGAIRADGDLNIVLTGSNTITLPGTAQTGIKVNGKLTISCASSSEDDSLTIKQVTTSTSANLIVTGGVNEARACEINGGTVTLNCSAGSSDGMGIQNSVYVNNDASLTIVASYRGVGRELHADTTGTVSVKTLGKAVGSAAVGALYANGSGTVSLSADKEASTLINSIYVAPTAGNVMLDGYTKVAEAPYQNFSIAPNKQLSSISSQSIESYYCGYYTSSAAGAGYYLTDGEGNPLPAAIIAASESQPLKVMDSKLFDLPDMLVGVPFRSEMYLLCATRGGEGEYSFSLKEGSRLPAGLIMNSATGQISGTPAAPCDAGYAIVVARDKSGHSFELRIDYGTVEDCDVVAPTITGSSDPASGKPRITWQVVPGAEKYEVFRASSKNGSFSKYYTTTGTSYTNTSAVAGYTYYYKVRAIGYDGTVSDFSVTKDRTCDCARPVVTAGNNDSSGKIKLTWKAVAGADRYEIYRASSVSGSFKKQYTTTSTSYTNTTSIAGSTYYYQVVAVSDISSYATSAFSEAVSGTAHCAQPKVKISSNEKTGKLALTWSGIEGASKYVIYRSNSKDGIYAKMYTTTSTSYTNTTSVAGYTYYYKVVAICADGDEGNSAESVPVYRTCDCARPDVSITTKGTTKNKPKLTWKAVDGATSYIVYRATTKNGSYSKMLETTNTSYTNTTATKGKAYFYKVKAVSKLSTSADSAYSSIVSITSG